MLTFVYKNNGHLRFLRIDDVCVVKKFEKNESVQSLLEAAKPNILDKLLENSFSTFLFSYGMHKKEVKNLPTLKSNKKKVANDQKIAALSPIPNKSLWKESCIRLNTARAQTGSITDDNTRNSSPN
jgi:hypothetical protein